jgi:hypothetical protein
MFIKSAIPQLSSQASFDVRLVKKYSVVRRLGPYLKRFGRSARASVPSPGTYSFVFMISQFPKMSITTPGKDFPGGRRLL